MTVKPADPQAFHEWRYMDAPQPKRRPPAKRSRRDRLRTRTLYLQRLLKRSAW